MIVSVYLAVLVALLVLKLPLTSRRDTGN
jgi:hypothetical protein